MVSNAGLVKGRHMVYGQNVDTVTLNTDTEIRGITSDIKQLLTFANVLVMGSTRLMTLLSELIWIRRK